MVFGVLGRFNNVLYLWPFGIGAFLGFSNSGGETGGESVLICKGKNGFESDHLLLT